MPPRDEDRSLLEEAQRLAFQRLEQCGGDLSKLALVDQTIVVVTSAQGVIDNGGFEYFFENDWPGRPQYRVFSDAYRRIGAPEAAASLDEASLSFTFADPHLRQDERRRFVASLPADHRFRQLGNDLCGDASVWDLLAAYVRAGVRARHDGV
jgi:hypothetical protein